MAYETGVATDVIDLLAKIRSLADDLGWTIDRHDPAELALHHADAGYFTLRATPEEDDIQTNWDPGPSISIWGHTGFDAGAAHNAQPGSSGGEYGRTNALRGPFAAYHLFGTTQYIHCVIEIVPGEFGHFHVGRLDKTGAYTGGEYVTGTRWDYYLAGTSYHNDASSNQHAVPFDGVSYYGPGQGAVRLDADGYTGEWGAFKYIGSDSQAWGPLRLLDNHSRSPYSHYWVSTPNTVNALSPLAPILVAFLLRDTKTFLAGAPADLRIVNMRNLTPGETITIGTDEWLCFPIKKRGLERYGPEHEVNSGIFGFAYRKVES
ncbi:MAG: hypothetical protein CL549_16130 [Alcanivorax sp.]|nr:hypothetical protein [Alcanivorax sp.]MAY11987.1 hypothetical protein [Alcanivorax sp.]MBI55589.1 hypothetical protein [Alcanivorax sp.]|tara:strand:+ start:1733 stop:2689 length:957 start_codon:yes stop_codon:yes gene_type:complete